MEIDDKLIVLIKLGRCYECGVRGYWSWDCLRKDEFNKMKFCKNFILILRNFEIKMYVKVVINLLNICSFSGLKLNLSEWEEMGVNKSIV